MAKSNFLKTVKEVQLPEPIIVEPIIITEETKTVIGIALAEQLQKAGWQLIDCHLTPNGKEYKFKKGK